MQLISSQLLSDLSKSASESPRLRMNYNFHSDSESPSQRLLNALEPGTDLPIHRHRHTEETYIVLKGSLIVKFYDDNKNLTAQAELNPQKENFGINIPVGQWHTIEVLEAGTVIFECKDGPYRPLDVVDIL